MTQSLFKCIQYQLTLLKSQLYHRKTQSTSTSTTFATTRSWEQNRNDYELCVFSVPHFEINFIYWNTTHRLTENGMFSQTLALIYCVSPITCTTSSIGRSLHQRCSGHDYKVGVIFSEKFQFAWFVYHDDHSRFNVCVCFVAPIRINGAEIVNKFNHALASIIPTNRY